MKSVVATFESRASAEHAAEMLADSGIERRAIAIHSGPWTDTTRENAGETRGWWEWLFGTSGEHRDYTEELERGGAVLTATVPDDQTDRVSDYLETLGADVEETTAEPDVPPQREVTAQQSASSVRGTGPSDEVIPVVEERLKIGKRPVSRGGVRIYSRVDEQPVEEQVRLRDERVRVDRRPVDRAASPADEAFRDREIEVTETAEEVVVGKEARVVAEVTVAKEVGERVETVRDAVRRTDVEVENLGADPGREHLLAQHDEDFRRHWSTNSQHREVPYEEGRSAYGYGCGLASDPRYTGRDWSGVEPEAERDWERQRPGTWERFKDSIRYSWERARQEHRRAA